MARFDAIVVKVKIGLVTPGQTIPTNTYFHRVSKQTPTRFWVNNPTLTEAKKAIEAGATGSRAILLLPKDARPIRKQ